MATMPTPSDVTILHIPLSGSCVPLQCELTKATKVILSTCIIMHEPEPEDHQRPPLQSDNHCSFSQERTVYMRTLLICNMSHCCISLAMHQAGRQRQGPGVSCWIALCSSQHCSFFMPNADDAISNFYPEQKECDSTLY